MTKGSKKKKNVNVNVTEKVKQVGASRAGSALGSAPRMQLANSSYYLASLRDPFNFPGSKIPDLISLPSATTQCVQRLQLTINAAGVAGIWLNFGTTSTSTSGYQLTDTAATSTSLTWQAITPKSYSTNFGSVAQTKRLVSGYVSIEYQGAPLNRKGRMVMDFEGFGSGFVSAPTTVSSVLVRPFVEDVPAAAVPFGMVRYIPQDNNALVYNLPSANTAFGYGGIIIDGANAGDIVEFTIVENFEFIPLSNTISLITPTPSISDPIEMSVAANAIALNPSFPVDQPTRDPSMGKIGTSGMRVHPPEATRHTGSEPTMFEKILAGIQKSLPVAKDVVGTGLAIGKMVAPLLL